MKEIILQYLSTLGLAGLWAGVFIESMGVPFPGGVMVILAGFLVGQGRLSFHLALVAAVTGFIMGSTTAFFVGKFIGEPFLKRCGKYLHVTPRTFNSARDKFNHSSAAVIILGRFVPGISNVSPYLAGISHLGLVRFVIYNMVFALIWGGLYLGVGMFFGHRWNVVSDKLQLGLPVFALGLLAVYVVIKVLKKHFSTKRYKI